MDEIKGSAVSPLMANTEDAFGYIAVSVRTADGALPIERAVVTVKDEAERLLGVFFTDEDGNTPRLSVAAPPIANSESPGMPGSAFYRYNIDTDKAGYRSVRNLGVPVYPGVTSVQPVNLVPLVENGSGFENDAIEYSESETPNL